MENNTLPTPKHGRGSVMVRICFPSSDTENHPRMEGKTSLINNSANNQKILGKIVKMTRRKLKLGCPETFNKKIIFNNPEKYRCYHT